MPHLISLGLIRVHLLHEHEAKPLFLLALLPAPLELCNAHLGLDVFIILLLIVRSLSIYRTSCPTRPAPSTRNGHRPAADDAWRTLLLGGLARLLGFALPAALFGDSPTTAAAAGGTHG